MKEKKSKTLKVTDYFKLWQRTLLLIWDAVPRLTTLRIGLLILQGLIPATTIYFTKLTIDSFVEARNATGDTANFNQIIYYFALTGLFMLAAEILQSAADLVQTAQAEYLSDYLKNLIHKKSGEVDLEFYESPEYHDLIEQVRGESQTKPLALLENISSAGQNLIILASFAAMLFSYSWFIPPILLLGALPGLYVSVKYDRIFHDWWKRTATDRRRLIYFDSMLSHSNAAAEMRLFNLNVSFRTRYAKLRERLRNEKFLQLRRQFAGKGFAGFITLLTAGSVTAWLGLKVFYKTATLGDLAVFYQVFTRSQAIMRSLLGNVGQTVTSALYLESLFAYLDLPSKIASPAETVPFPSKISFGINFRDITFRYPNTKHAALENFNLFIPAGKIAAIVGVNGAGKSTLVKLLSRFYDVGKGSIEIDGTDIRRFKVEELRRNISILFQFPMQFHETVAANIALGDTETEPNSAKFRIAAERAGAHRFISKLPEKYETVLGKWFINGCELSGGEWQRIALARAYFRNSKLIVLDEPTSFMDSWTEADWFDRFRASAENRTGLIITHRFSIAMRADIIYVLDGGRLIESGTHAELVDADGFYAQSWKTQSDLVPAANDLTEKAVIC